MVHKHKLVTHLFKFFSSFEMQLFLGWAIAVHVIEVLLLPSLPIPLQMLPQFSLTERFVHVWLTSADTLYYVQIAKEGYVHTSFVFFPLWPLVMKLVGANPLGVKLLSITLTGIFVILLSKLLTLWGFERYKRHILVAVIIFPFSFMLITPMSEPLFLVCLALTFYFMKQKKWLWGALAAGAVTATRMIGIVIVIYVFWVLIKEALKLSTKLALLAISSSGLLIYALYLEFWHGNFLLFYTQEKMWNRALGASSVQKLFTDMSMVVSQIFGENKPHPIDLLHFLAVPLFIFLAMMTYRKLDRGIWLYCTIALIIPLLSGTFLGMPRYLLATFPLFVGLGVLFKKVPVLFYFYIAVSLMLQAWLMIRFFNYEMVA